jgi:hypothetical protein
MRESSGLSSAQGKQRQLTYSKEINSDELFFESRMFQMSMKRMGLVIILTFLWTPMSRAQEMPVPVKVQIPLFLKILTFDRKLKTRVGDEIVIGVVYQRKFRKSLNVKERFVDMMDESSITKVEDIPIRQVSIDIDKTDLAGAVSRNNIDILYVAPLRALGVKRITGVSRAKRILTLTGVPDYVESGLAVGIGIKGEKPRVIINSPAAKAEGADFSSQLLKLAKVIK